MPSCTKTEHPAQKYWGKREEAKPDAAPIEPPIRVWWARLTVTCVRTRALECRVNHRLRSPFAFGKAISRCPSRREARPWASRPPGIRRNVGSDREPYIELRQN